MTFIGYDETECQICGCHILIDPQEVGDFICGDCRKAVLDSRKKRAKVCQERQNGDMT